VYVPLRVHSVYSKGRGSVTLPELAGWVRGAKLPAAALSDLGNVYGWAGWNRAARETGCRPLFGCEIEVGGRRFLFLVQSLEGYWNLMTILNTGGMEDTSGLASILVPQPRETDPLDGPDFVRPENLYLGADFFKFPQVRRWAEQRGLPMVWANPLKFVTNPDRLILLHAIDKKRPYPPEKARLGKRARLYGPDQESLAVKKFGAGVRGAFDGAARLAGECRFDFAGIIPKLPEDLFEVSLREEVMRRLRAAKGLSWEERQRARRELSVVEKSGFAPYFLVVHDVVEFARRNGILHNLKGSGASSYLAYLLGISHISPIAFDLYFDRFLNKGRDDPPDFDLDFDSSRRDKILTYVLEKYSRGRTGAAFVCSIKNFRARSALYETARAFGLPPDESRILSKKAPYFALPEELKKDKPLPGYTEIWRAAADLSFVYSEPSLHVGGVILTPSPAERYLPLSTSAKGYRMSHFDRDAVEDLKLIKLDLLSIRGLAAISETKTALRLKDLPQGEKKTFARMQDARTIGCFQVESPAMMNLLRRMKPASIRDLTQALALIRPGPTESGMKETLLRGREGRPVPRDAFLGKILPETGGLLLYEEQVMQIAERVAGLPPHLGDLLRRGLKKKGGCDPQLRTRFFQEADERGYTTSQVRKLWRVMEEFSSYSFNKAHSASYAHMAYQAVYLKTHHPVIYFTAVLNAGGGYYGIPEYIEEAKRMGIGILGPDINRSRYVFTTEGKGIRVGLTSIKGMALRTAEKIIEEREGGDYASVEDVLFRVKLTKSELFTLIKAGVFDSLEPKRTRQILRYFQGVSGMDEVADLAAGEKRRMIIESLGFDPGGDSLDLVRGKRPPLRIRDLGGYVGREAELLVRVVDARLKGVSGGRKYFFLFEDETGLLEGVGESKCLSFGDPPACFLRGEVRGSTGGRPKIFNCTFLKP
jgi:DNA polymerase-3 subunit alpha